MQNDEWSRSDVQFCMLDCQVRRLAGDCVQKGWARMYM